MNNDLHTLKQKLASEKKHFLMLLQKLQTAYPQYKSNPIDDHISQYNDIETSIDKRFETLFTMKSDLLRKSDDLAMNMASKDAVINDTRTLTQKQENELTTVRNNGYASIPRSDDIQKQLTLEIIYSGIQSIVLLSSGYFLTKLLTS